MPLFHRQPPMASVMILTLVLAGCAVNRSETAEGAPLARQVTQSDHCGLTAPGLVYVSSAQQVPMLAELPAQNLSLEPLRALDFEREHLVLVGLGQKPTGGYGVTLESSVIAGDTLQLRVSVRRPAPGSLVTQALTTPCAVIAISPEDWERLEVSGDGLGTMTRQRP